MEENTNMTEQVTQAENMGNESEAQGTDQATAGAGKEQKLFTQKEVNGFVHDRISRLKGQIEKESKAEYSQKLAELETREMKLVVKERLYDRSSNCNGGAYKAGRLQDPPGPAWNQWRTCGGAYLL